MRLIVDVDGTLTRDDSSVPYSERMPRSDVIARVNGLHARGVRIIIYSARNMRTYKGNVGLINKNTLPVLMGWLERHGVRYDEIHMGKPWCGADGFYIQSRSLRPDSFVTLPFEEIETMLGLESGEGATRDNEQ
jgi:capsule biosynthesis phosphatase